jgi:hypothetical protein
MSISDLRLQIADLGTDLLASDGLLVIARHPVAQRRWSPPARQICNLKSAICNYSTT